jgi:hypothetical protein
MKKIVLPFIALMVITNGCDSQTLKKALKTSKTTADKNS